MGGRFPDTIQTPLQVIPSVVGSALVIFDLSRVGMEVVEF